ncbi:MAG: hypothetical protein M3O03_02525 [Pseudomonadota bacterium]|nr:hypothetical protein [Pseudomonadota bacterium]
MDIALGALILIALVGIPLWFGRGKRVTKDKWNAMEGTYDNGANGTESNHSSSHDGGHSADSSH